MVEHSYKFYEKFYYSFVYSLFPVVRKFEIEEGKFTDLKLTINYTKSYDSEPKSFGNALRFTIQHLNKYIGGELPTITIILVRGDEIVWGSFIEDNERYYEW